MVVVRLLMVVVKPGELVNPCLVISKLLGQMSTQVIQSMWFPSIVSISSPASRAKATLACSCASQAIWGLGTASAWWHLASPPKPQSSWPWRAGTRTPKWRRNEKRLFISVGVNLVQYCGEEGHSLEMLSNQLETLKLWNSSSGGRCKPLNEDQSLYDGGHWEG